MTHQTPQTPNPGQILTALVQLLEVAQDAKKYTDSIKVLTTQVGKLQQTYTEETALLAEIASSLHQNRIAVGRLAKSTKLIIEVLIHRGILTQEVVDEIQNTPFEDITTPPTPPSTP